MKSSLQRWFMSATATNAKSTSVWFPQTQIWMRMKSSGFMESTGILRCSLRYARVTLTWAESAIPCPMMQWQHIPQLFLPDTWCCHWKAGNPTITVPSANSFYIFLMRCLISHGYRLFKCCFKCSGRCLQKIPSYQMRKSANWWMHLWMRFQRCWKPSCGLHKSWSLIIEWLPGIEFSRCIAKIYVRSLSY